MDLILFLGNSIYSDDKIALLIGEKLKERLEAEGFDVKILERTGYSLIDYIAGYDNVFVVDSIPGNVGEVIPIEKLEDIKLRFSKSPHYAGLPEAIELMKALNLSPPSQLRVLGIGVKDPFTISEKISPELESKIDSIAEKVYSAIKGFKNNKI